jgi:hypothetical protein
VCARHTKEKFMRNKLLITGMLAGLLTFGFVMFGCDHNSRPVEGPPPGAELVGDWYDSQSNANAGIASGLKVRFGSDGNVLYIAEDASKSYTVKQQGNIIIAGTKGTYTIDKTKLSLKDFSSSENGPFYKAAK